MNLSDNHNQALTNQKITEFDIHGIVALRLVNPTAVDVETFEQRLGSKVSLKRDPDITIRFIDDLDIPRLTFLGLNSAGFTDEGFYILEQRTGKAIARIPFENVGGECEIIYKRGSDSTPLLFDIIRLTFLKKGFIPLHASAFLYDGAINLVMGWAKGGKTSILLAFANHGAQYVGDEWIIISADGQKIFGLITPVSLSEWQFKYIPQLLPKISLEKKILFKGIHFLDATYRTFGHGRLKQAFPLKILDRALPILNRQLKVQVLPQDLFKENPNILEGTPERLFLTMSHSEAGIQIEPCDPTEIAQRMVNANEYELTDFFEFYQAFKFAFPHLQNNFLEQVGRLQRSLLYSALAGIGGYKVLHPYPVSFEALFKELQPFCRKPIDESVSFEREKK